jgi:3-deoxy-7-phosphoheptulonate synthase
LGMKCGPTLQPDDLLRVLAVLNPANQPGRITLITRMGADRLSANLPGLIRAVQREGCNVVWCCDPMHGNTMTSANGRKTRSFDRILAEVRAFFAIHAAERTRPGGIHLEMTGKDVTECLGGAQRIAEADLERCYQTQCDPRLNGTQALELAFLVAELLREKRDLCALLVAAE